MNNNSTEPFNRKEQFRNMISSFTPRKEASQSLSLKASKMRAFTNSYQFTSTYKDKAKVAFIGDEFPQEILFPFRLFSINFQTLAGLFSNSPNFKRFFSLADELYLTKDICSNVRGGIGLSFANCIPTPDIVFGNSSPCNGSTKLSYFLSQKYGSKYVLLDTPHSCDDHSISYLANQLKKAVREIEKVLNLEFDEEKFLKIIEYSNKAKGFFSKTIDLCRTNRLPAVQRELYEIVVSNPWGMKEYTDICKTLYEEALEQSKSKDNVNDKKRILWYGQVPTYAHDLMEYLRQNVDVIFYTSLNKCHLSFLDMDQPFESIAKRSILYSWNPFTKGQDILNVCEKFNISGIIIQNSWGCRNLNGTNRIVRDLVVQGKLKYIIIDSDFVDQEKFSFSQVKNRIDAFLEAVL